MLITKFEQAFYKIQKAHNILFITHQRPDGDAISSTCLMIELAKHLKKQFVAFCSDKLNDNNFSFLPNVENITDNINSNIFKNFDLIIALDCGNLKRTGMAEKLKNKELNQFIIEFDHHPKVDNYSDLEIRLPEASSTTEVLYNLLKINNIKITKNIANCVLTGILTDTSNFLHQNTSEKAINIASEMLMYGARMPQIIKNTLYNKNLPDIKLLSKALDDLTINKKYNFAFSILTLKDIHKANVTDDIYNAITGFLSNLHGVKAILLLREEKNKVRGSLRSVYPGVDVSKLANLLGGGGHAKASGFVMENCGIKKIENKWSIISN
ncbi:MAG: bifunctional oligoribonuclease/PAP phosphatase NrnA [Patescibacteria group bacterium]|nr:bifunctional oligoribonuclease/PAP phosphatase NrnA [Patescibacteria group bacterium]MBU1160668.1 bifunctional oligoribonuclease/PAP phosphatase NrnA [Patescibacteria group bacterium]MBU1349637.1 bifunctional oligoribonuclease/PAP phosphatase NrnA [Patescibacteria group bacterium]MBU1421273.1 bifunctional oligoribonuclease/PAP phosphatase NrnA [Patescibacteria group bacterium]MBU1684031.1 bifunctional oligoribonuclease/PAP phosphatase NrnA [Patescibacteria group bacterium]